MAARLTDAGARRAGRPGARPGRGPDSAPVRADLATALDELRAALASDRYAELLARLDALLEGPTARTVDAAVGRPAGAPGGDPGGSDPLDRALAGDHHGGGEQDAALHEARKADKAARYAVEVREPTVGERRRTGGPARRSCRSVLGDTGFGGDPRCCAEQAVRA